MRFMMIVKANKDTEIELRQLFELEDFGESDAVDRHRALEQKLAKT
jgi:hypothetical protein